MGFFDSIVSGVKSGFNTIKKAVVTPVYNTVVKPVYNKVVKPVAERGIKYVSHTIDRVERVADAGTRGLEGVGDLLNSKPFMYMALGVGAIVVVNMTKQQ